MASPSYDRRRCVHRTSAPAMRTRTCRSYRRSVGHGPGPCPTERRDTVKPVSGDDRQQFAGRGILACCTVDGKRLGNRQSIGGTGSAQDLLVDGVDRSEGNQIEPELVGVVTDQDIDVRTRPGSNAIDWACREQVPVDHRLEWHQVSRNLSPACKGGISGDFSSQFPLGLNETVDGDRCDGLTRRFDAQLLCKVPTYTLPGCR